MSDFPSQSLLKHLALESYYFEENVFEMAFPSLRIKFSLSIIFHTAQKNEVSH